MRAPRDEVTSPFRRSMIRRRVIVAGRVQGVFFRASCRDVARAKGVAGSARNRSDGRVEIHLEGPPAAVEEVIAWCRTGPPQAKVTGVEVDEEDPVGARGFDVS